MTLSFSAALAFGLLSVVAAWFWSRRVNNAGVIDIVWGLNLGAMALIHAALGQGWGPRRWVLAALVAAAGFRLALYLYRRVLAHPEEGRYVALRQEWSQRFGVERARRRMFGFFVFQALLAAALSAPVALAAQNSHPSFHLVEGLALSLGVLAFLGESLADAQLARFKRDPAHRGRVCREGLWAYSRHPNYFFEWLIWVSQSLYALASPWGWLGLYAPALMLHFLTKVTGVKATEEQCLRSKGQAYADYQRETSMFIPWFPKKSPLQVQP